MTCRNMKVDKEIAMGVAAKKEVSRDPKVKIQNKKCGGPMKKPSKKGGRR